MLGLAQPTLRVMPYGQTVFLRRNPSTTAGTEPDKETALVRGDVVLSLPKARILPGPIVVKFFGKYEIWHPSMAEAGTVHEQELVIETHNALYEKGDHVFYFQFGIPLTIPTNETNEFGCIHYFVRAETKGLGLAGGSITASHQIYPVLNRASDGELLQYNLEVQNVLPELGPFISTITAPHLTVASPLVVTLEFPSVPRPVSISNINLCITQTVILTSLSDPTRKPVQPPTRRLHVFTIDKNHPPSRGSHPSSKTHLATLTPGGPTFIMAHRARLPCENPFRPSTARISDLIAKDQTVYPFVFSHAVELSVGFQVEGEESKTLYIKRPVEISSCCCHIESQLVPPYTKDDPLSSARALKHKTEGTFPYFSPCEAVCLCNTPGSTLMKQLVMLGPDGIVGGSARQGVTAAWESWEETSGQGVKTT